MNNCLPLIIMSCLPVIIGLFKKKMDGEGRGGWEYINVILSKPTHHTILIKISFRSHHTRLNMVFIIKSTYATRGYHRWFSLSTLISSTNKIYCYNKTEITTWVFNYNSTLVHHENNIFIILNRTKNCRKGTHQDWVAQVLIKV
jgi:hypothetical protein